MRSVTLGATLFFVALIAEPALAARLHPGDQVDVLVYNHPELSGTRTLDASGSISLPLAGTVPAAGLEPEALAKAVRAKLTTYVRHAAVDVRLAAQTSSIFVDGGPVGALKYEPGETLITAVEQLTAQTSQGLKGSATGDSGPTVPLANVTTPDLINGPEDYTNVRLQRDGTVSAPYDVIALHAAGEPGPALIPGDEIVLTHKPVAVKVAGDVGKPVTAYLAPDEPLEQALVQAGGITATGSQDGILLRRGATVQRISAGAPDFALPARDGDQLVVRRAPRVDVIGQVVKPGETYLRGDATLVSAIYYAGGPAEFANLKVVVLIHDGVRHGYDITKLQHGASGDNPVVADGDIVMVPKGSTFRVNDIWEAIGSLGFFGLRL